MRSSVDRLFGGLGIVLRIQRLGQHHLNQGRMRRELDRAVQRGDRLRGFAAFEQRLALQLVEIGVVRLRRDQGVDLGDGGAQVGMPIGRDRARVSRRQALVVDRIAAGDRVGAIQEADQLGAHQVVTQLQLRRILLVPVRARLGELFERRTRSAGIGCDCM